MIIIFNTKDNMECLQHNYILTWVAFKPFILCLSCNKWSCIVLIKIVEKNENAVIRPRCYRESTCCQSTYKERHVWDSINCAIFAEWRTQKLWSCFNFKLYKYKSHFRLIIFMSLCIHNMLSGGNQTDGNTLEIFLTPYQNSRLCDN